MTTRVYILAASYGHYNWFVSHHNLDRRKFIYASDRHHLMGLRDNPAIFYETWMDNPNWRDFRDAEMLGKIRRVTLEEALKELA